MVTRMTFEQLKELVKNEGGFVMKLTSGCSQGIIIPSGFLAIFNGHEGVGMRWSLSSDQADRLRSITMIKAMTESFVELRDPSTGLMGLLEYLEHS